MAVENQTLAPFYTTNRNPFNYEKIEQINRDVSTSWLTLEECTQQLNLYDDESQDSYIASLELAARMAIEDYLGFSILPITYRTYYCDPGFTANAIYLDLPETTPITATVPVGVVINSVKFWTGDNNSEINVLDPSNYYLDAGGNRVVVTAGLPEPLAQNMAYPIQVEFTVNSNYVSTYPVIKQAGLMLLTHLYNNRDTVGNTVQQQAQIPFGVSTLLRPYKPLVM